MPPPIPRSRLLPSSATDIEHLLDFIVAERIESIFTVETDSDRADPSGRANPVQLLWDVKHCPIDDLVFLAYIMSVSDYPAHGNALNTEQVQNLILTSYEVHRIKGTFGSIKKLVENVGYGTPAITQKVDGYWWKYNVTLTTQITVEAAILLRQLIMNIMPLPYRLNQLVYPSTIQSYIGTINYQGNHTYGG